MNKDIKVDEKTLLPIENVKVMPELQMEFDVDFWQSLDIKIKPKYEMFAQLIVQGKTATQAYYEATKACSGKELTRKTCAEKGCKLLQDNDVLTRIKQLYKVVTSQFVMSDIELHKHLTDIIRNKDEKTADRINAIKLLAQIKGLAKGDTEVHTSQHFVNLQVEVVESKNNNLKVIDGGEVSNEVGSD